jgi:hypothetical protein
MASDESDPGTAKVSGSTSATSLYFEGARMGCKKKLQASQVYACGMQK